MTEIDRKRKSEPHHAWNRGLLAAGLALCLTACGGGGETGAAGGPGGGDGSGGDGTDFGDGANDPVALEEVDLDFTVSNLHSSGRQELITASIPFPERAVNNLGRLGVPGFATTWVPMQRWADGSIRVAQVQLFDSIEGGSKKTYRVEQEQEAITDAFQPHPWVASQWASLELGARVRDRFGHKYEAQISGDGETLQTTALKRVRRWRLYHESPTNGGIGRDYLASTFYVTEHRDTPFLVVDWIFGNDYQGIDANGGLTDPNMHPLGAVDVDDAALVTDGFAQVQPYRPDWHDMQDGVVEGDGRTAHVVMDGDWIADGQTRRYRFTALVEDAGASGDELQVWRDRFTPFAEHGPVRALTARLAWAQCRGLGLLGGPVAGPANAGARAEEEYLDWLGRNHFGRWGSFGDAKFSNATGTPRNSGLGEELAWAVQSGDVRLLRILESKCWAQANRPMHMYGLVVGAEQDIQLWEGVPMSLNDRWHRDLAPESLGRRALTESDPWATYRSRMDDSGKPHDWNAYDISHWTSDLYFDYWTITGDEWAKEELRLMGQCCRGIMHYHGYVTDFTQYIRAEGWTMQSQVQAYLATGDEALKTKAIRRTRDVVKAQQLTDHPSRVIRTDNPDNRVEIPGDDYRWYPAWQHYALFYGYMGAYRFFGDDVFLELCEEGVHSVSYASVENYTDPVSGDFYEFGLRYGCLTHYEGVEVAADHLDSLPDYSILISRSTERTVAAGMLHVASWTQDAAVAAEARRIAKRIVPEVDDNGRWSKWTYLVPESEYESLQQ